MQRFALYYSLTAASYFLTFPISVAIASVTSDYSLQYLPSQFSMMDQSISNTATADTSLTLGVLSDGRALNPAFQNEVTDNSLTVKAIIGNGYKAFDSANQLLFKPITQEFLQTLFTTNDITGLTAEGSLHFTGPLFSTSFTPYRLIYFSKLSNPNFPALALHASLETAFSISSGRSLEFLSPNLSSVYLGVKASLFRRRFVHTSFSLAEVFLESKDKLVPVTAQNGFSFEPSFRYEMKHFDPTILNYSLTVHRLGKVWDPSPYYESDPDVTIGGSVVLNQFTVKPKLALQWQNVFSTSDFLRHIALGADVEYGILHFLGGISGNYVSTGVLFKYRLVGAALAYQWVRDDIEDWIDENKLTTEFSLYL